MILCNVQQCDKEMVCLYRSMQKRLCGLWTGKMCEVIATNDTKSSQRVHFFLHSCYDKKSFRLKLQLISSPGKFDFLCRSTLEQQCPKSPFHAPMCRWRKSWTLHQAYSWLLYIPSSASNIYFCDLGLCYNFFGGN